MTGFLAPDDIAIWLCAKPWLDVRSNDEHTLISYWLAQALLRRHPDADDRVVLPAVLLHDVGWKMFPEEKLAHASVRMRNTPNCSVNTKSRECGSRAIFSTL